MLITRIHEIKLIIKLALPLMAVFLAQKGMQLVDTLMMGWIGPQALAAGALGTSIFMTILVFCMGTFTAIGICIAHARGTNHPADIQSSLQHGLYLAIILSLPCMLLIWFSPQILLLLGEDPHIVGMTQLLLHGLVWGIPGFLLFLVFREFISAFALVHVVMLVALLSIPLTFVANYIFIYGKYGLPQLGIAGIGYAGAGVMWFMFFCLLFYSRKHPTLREHVISLNVFKFDYDKIRDLFYVGAPSGIIFVLDVGMFLMAAIMMGYFSIDALAAHQIAMQCVTIAYAIPFALSTATALQVGHAKGSKNLLQAKRSAYLGLGMGLIASAIIAILFILAPETFVKLFLKVSETHYNAIKELAASFLAVAALFQCFDAVQAIANGTLRGLKDTLIPMLLSIGCYWVLGVGSAYYFAFHTHLGATGIWYGLTLGICSAGIMLMLRFLQRLNRVQEELQSIS